MKYYKVCLGYNEFISIDETELDKALQAQTRGAIVVLKGGSANGKSITHIVPDYHKALGYNYGYKLEAEDYALIRNMEINYAQALESCRQKLIG